MVSKTFQKDKNTNKKNNKARWNDTFLNEYSRQPTDIESRIWDNAYNIGHKNGRKERYKRNFRTLKNCIIKILQE